MKNIKRECSTCWFFRKDSCHRNPPTIEQGPYTYDTQWPSVKPEDFCGEWQANQGEIMTIEE